jgi:hypothetical protein
LNTCVKFPLGIRTHFPIPSGHEAHVQPRPDGLSPIPPSPDSVGIWHPRVTVSRSGRVIDHPSNPDPPHLPIVIHSHTMVLTRQFP